MPPYEIIREGEEIILRINCEQLPYFPSIEEDPKAMAMIIDTIIEAGNITKIVLEQKRDYEYDYSQTEIITDLAKTYKKIIQYKKPAISPECHQYIGAKYIELQNITRQIKSDPIQSYTQLKKSIQKEKHNLDKTGFSKTIKKCLKEYLIQANQILQELEQTKLIKQADLTDYSPGSREPYRKIFQPITKPDFMYTKLLSAYPSDSEQLDSYMVGNTEITLFRMPNSVQTLYHIVPPEFKLTEEKYEILDAARKIMAEHQPKRSEFTDPERMRQVFLNIGKDLLDELAGYRNIRLRQKEKQELAQILIRYTVGFGLIEVLMQDEKIQDITINSPMGRISMFIVHAEHGDCITNIIPTPTEAESWASKLRMISGRPLDEANPILDTELQLPQARTRVAAITAPLNPTGLAYALRRHRDRPWTLPLFIQNKMITPLAAGLISFLIDGARTMLVAGTRSAGKTSFLGSMMVEIMRKGRIVTVEDTLELPTSALRTLKYNIQSMKVASALTRGTTEVSADEGIRTTLRLGDSSLIVGEVRSSLRGDQQVFIVEKGITKRIAIKDLEGKKKSEMYVPTLTNEYKIELKKLTGFVKHPKRKKLLKITTNTGREITVTPDHSIFTITDFKVAAINSNAVKTGDPIVIPAKMPCGYNDIQQINLLELFKNDYRLENAEQYIRKAIKKIGWKKSSEICRVSDIYRYLLSTQKTRIPINRFLDLMAAAQIDYKPEELQIKRGTSKSLPAFLSINEEFLRFLGYYIAEGNINKGTIQITNSKPKIIEDVHRISRTIFGLEPKKREIRGLGKSVQTFILCRPLSDLLIKLGCGKKSKEKRVPSFVYGLSKNKICALLRGMYSGDGSFSTIKNGGSMIRYFSTSKDLVEDVMYLLLSTGIVGRIIKREAKKVKPENKDIFYVEFKQRKYIEQFLKNVGFTHKTPNILKKAFAHSKEDTIFFSKEELERNIKISRKYRHLRRTHRCSKDYLKKIVNETKCSDEIYNFANGDFFIDKIKRIEPIELKKAEYVYDLSVKTTERFIGGFGGILLHNTEAKALYEAMRVGALANVVAGTIHGDSPYGVFDRVVNDLEVPKTSFKATDIIIVANPIRSPDGLHRYRRITEITEVRKYWEEDPLRENGFVDLMKYNAETDQLEPTPNLLNGDSEILKSIAGNVKEWAGNWDAVWENIELRTQIKQKLTEYAEKLNKPELLEAEFTINANDEFHRISKQVKEETGKLDTKKILFKMEEWLKRNSKKQEQ